MPVMLPNGDLFKEKTLKKISAERDIAPEEVAEDMTIHPDGKGITNAIQSFINRTDLPRDLIKKNFLSYLNKILDEDAQFEDILCQIDEETKKWEIYLSEKNKGDIALSNSGSGLKTVIVVLAFLLLIPEQENKNLRDYIFCFEELENNIHPSLLRRLNHYIYELAIKNDFIYFLTTHSNVLIDAYSKDENAQILHVTQRNGLSTCVTVKTYVENNGILDDLDIRASDLLQANGIIWVEGPSDRIYINHWISLWSDKKLKEGNHYQILFYGGRLLAHLGIGDQQYVSILNANRNAIIVMDSDKKNINDELNYTKIRIRNACYHYQLTSPWITEGREIENYISWEVLKSLYSKNDIPPVPQKYASFFAYLGKVEKDKDIDRKYSHKKTLLAESVVAYMTSDNMKDMLDLDERMKEVCREIRKWNSISETVRLS